MDLDKVLRVIPDFPIEGVNFRDITPIFDHPEAFNYIIEEMKKIALVEKVDKLGCFDARGFIFAPPVARDLGIPFFTFRKKGKLPWKTIEVEYGLEYGTNVLEMHVDSVKPGERILLIDDLLATGGTAEAGCKLVEKSGGVVAALVFVIALPSEFDPSDKLGRYKTYSLLKY